MAHSFADNHDKRKVALHRNIVNRHLLFNTFYDSFFFCGIQLVLFDYNGHIINA